MDIKGIVSMMDMLGVIVIVMVIVIIEHSGTNTPVVMEHYNNIDHRDIAIALKV